MGALGCQTAGDGADTGPWSWHRWGCPGGLSLPCTVRTPRAVVEELALPPDFGLLPWEFAAAISWNMNLFIFKREQT